MEVGFRAMTACRESTAEGSLDGGTMSIVSYGSHCDAMRSLST